MSHYYEKTSNGVEPRHFVGVSSRPGELRPTRITDARKNAWYPSVTTIQGLLDKPALTDWKIQEHLKVAHELGMMTFVDAMGLGRELDDLSKFEDFYRIVKERTQVKLDRAPKDGTDFHDVLETWFSFKGPVNEKHISICKKVEWELTEHCGYGTKWITEKSFVHVLGFAGKCDIHSSDWVIDYKTKNSKDKWKPGKMAYPEMAMQLAAYRVGLALDNARCANVFICLEDGAVEFYEWGPETLDKQWANFADLLRIWLRNAEYVPGSVTAGKTS